MGERLRLSHKLYQHIFFLDKQGSVDAVEVFGVRHSPRVGLDKEHRVLWPGKGDDTMRLGVIEGVLGVDLADFISADMLGQHDC